VRTGMSVMMSELPVGVLQNSVMTPAVEIRPICLGFGSVNHRLPSGLVVMLVGSLLGVVVGNSSMDCARACVEVTCSADAAIKTTTSRKTAPRMMGDVTIEAVCLIGGKALSSQKQVQPKVYRISENWDRNSVQTLRLKAWRVLELVVSLGRRRGRTPDAVETRAVVRAQNVDDELLQGIVRRNQPEGVALRGRVGYLRNVRERNERAERLAVFPALAGDAVLRVDDDHAAPLSLEAVPRERGHAFAVQRDELLMYARLAGALLSLLRPRRCSVHVLPSTTAQGVEDGLFTSALAVQMSAGAVGVAGDGRAWRIDAD
jgi:hypothetical protein